MSTEEHFCKLERMYMQANVNLMIVDTTTCRISYCSSVLSKHFSGINILSKGIDNQPMEV